MKNLKNLLKNDSNIFYIVLLILVFGFYFLDKDLSKIFGIAGLFIWFLQKYTEQLFVKDLEKFKSDLEKGTIQFKIEYEKLHSERAEVIKEVYKKIVRTYRSFQSLMKPMQWVGEPTENEKGKKATNEINSLVDFYEENRIFFEEKIAIEIDKLLKKLKESWDQFNYSKYKTGGQYKDIDESRKAWKQISEDVPVIKKSIERKFRDIIGIEKK